MGFKVRQHLIYVVLAVIIGVLIQSGLWWAILVYFVFWRRFPKTYWIYFLISLGSFLWLTAHHQIPDSDHLIQDRMVTVLEVKQQTDVKQTAVVKYEGNRYYFNVQQTTPKLRPGDQIRFQSDIAQPMNSTVPHAFNFKHYLKGNGIFLTMNPDAFEWINHRFSIKQWQYDLGAWVEEVFPTRTAAYLNALLLGENEGLGETMRETYSNLGVIHLFAISGLHVGLLSLMLQSCLRRLGLIQELTDGLVILFIFFFCLISGASVSVIRASSMFILLTLNRRLKWKWSSLDLFSMIFLVNFLMNPLQIFQVGFIYSYWLTGMLICFQVQFKRLLRWQLFFYVPFIAQIVSFPLQVFFNYEINLFSYLMNLLLIPFVSSIGLPVLILTLLIPRLAPLLEPSILIFEQLMKRGETTFTFNWVTGELSLSVLIFLLLVFLIGSWWIEKSQQMKHWLYLLPVFILVIEANRSLKPFGQLTMLDVGQGDSVVIQSPYQQCTVVVDTGGKISFDGSGIQSIFERALKPYLMGEGVRNIDYLILTHGDWDHIGEVIPLLQTFKVQEILINDYPLNQQMQAIINLARDLQVNVRMVNQDEEVVCGNQTLTFLNSQRQSTNENDASLIFYLQMNELSAFLSGDISQSVEEQLVRRYNLPSVEVYKAAHHGSKTSNSQTLIEKLNPKLVIASAGRKNRYQHPSSDVVNQLNEMKIPLLTTQTSGSLQFKVAHKSYTLYVYPPE